MNKIEKRIQETKIRILLLIDECQDQIWLFGSADKQTLEDLKVLEEELKKLEESKQ